MRTKYILYLIVAFNFLFMSCDKNDDPSNESIITTELNLTPGEIAFMDSVQASLTNNTESLLKAITNPIVSLFAKQVSCNNFQLTVNVTQPVCPAVAPLVAYWTLFAGGKIIRLNPTYGNPCIQGRQLVLNYNVSQVTYVNVVLLAFEPKSYSSRALYSNTVILKPTCK